MTSAFASTLEAETIIAKRRDAASNMAAVTISATASGGRITEKKVLLSRSDTSGAAWSAPATMFATDTSKWITDPYVAIDSAGNVFVVALACSGPPTANPATCRLVMMVSTDAGATFPYSILQVDGPPNDPDQPVVVANPGKAGEVVVGWGDRTGVQARFASILLDTGQPSRLRIKSTQTSMEGGFGINPALAFDSSGRLYVLKNATTSLLLVRYNRNPLDLMSEIVNWNMALPSTVSLAGTLVTGDFQPGTDTSIKFADAIRRSLAVSSPGGTTTVYVSREEILSGQRRVSLAATSSPSLDTWAPVVLNTPSSAHSEFYAALSADDAFLDVVVFRSTAAGEIDAWWERLNAGQATSTSASLRQVFPDPIRLTTASFLASSLLFRRPVVETPDLRWLGEYNGAATLPGDLAVSTYPNPGGTGGADLHARQLKVRQSCVRVMLPPDDVFECPCICQDPTALQGPFTVSSTGCGAHSAVSGTPPTQTVDSMAACRIACGGSPCGVGQTCRIGVCSSPTGIQNLGAPGAPARLLDRACTVGAAASPAVTSVAAFRGAVDSAASTMTVNVGSNGGTDNLVGSLYFNLSSQQPTSGTTIEFARSELRGQDTMTVDMNLVEEMSTFNVDRFTGTFTSSTAFTVSPLMTQFVGQFTIGNTVYTFYTGNQNAITGTLDLMAGTFSLDGSGSDGSGNTMTLHAQGTLSNRPPTVNPIADQTVDCTSPSGAVVNLSGAVSDPNGSGDLLRYQWFDGDSPLANQLNASVQLGVGAHPVSLTAYDQSLASGMASATVNVRDPIAPVVAESEAISSVTGTTAFQDKTVLAFTTSASQYLILETALFQNTNTSKSSPRYTEIQAVVDGTVYSHSRLYPPSQTNWLSFAAHQILTFSAGESHTVKIRYATTSTAETASIKNARIVAIPIATSYSNGQAPETPVNNACPGGTWTAASGGTLQFVVPTPGEYLVVATAQLVGAGVGFEARMRLIQVGVAGDSGEMLYAAPVANTMWRTYATMRKVILSGVPTFKVQFNASTTSGCVDYKDVRITAIPLSAISAGNPGYGEVESPASTYSTDLVTVATGSVTSTPSQPYVVLGTALLQGNSNTAVADVVGLLDIDGVSAGEEQTVPASFADGGNTNDYVSFFNVRQASWADSLTHTSAISYRTTSGIVRARIKNARVLLLPVRSVCP